MFKKILIANRGEIAVRIIRACKEMDILTVAIYSTADQNALHVQLADEAVCVGGPKSADSYLNKEAIITAAVETGCQAIHPGFGFLSENSDFARLVETCGLKFIGPKGDVIDALGNKSKAREMMIEAGVPVVPGSNGSVNTYEELKEVVNEIGYPVLIKASAGGGGRDMYVEKLVLNPKHIEFQILADEHGNVIHLGERDCSIQRRNQKMIEEAPCKVLDASLRLQMGESAVKAAQGAGYTNAGTVEFVLDEHNNYYFIEMNSRIQVEHPITEMVTGIDLIKQQIRIASGLPLSFKQEDITLQGHSIECRINAEDPFHNFRPCPGQVNFMHLPGGPGVRVDTMLYTGYTLPTQYDSMVAKVIVHAPTRLEAIKRMRRALSELVIEGITTNQTLQFYILHQPDYIKGHFNTSFIETHLDEMVSENG